MQSVGAVVTVARAVQAGRCRQGGAGRPVHASISSKSVRGMLHRYAKRGGCSSRQGGAARSMRAGRCGQGSAARGKYACSHVRLRGSRSPNTPKIAAKIDPESRPGPSLRHLKSGLGRSRGDLGPQRGPRGVLGASWGAPGRSPGRLGEIPKAPRGCSGAPQGRRWSAWATCSGSAGAKRAAQVCHHTRDLFETHL